MPSLHKQKAGSIGQYFDGQISDGGRVLSREVHASTCAHCSRITEFPSQKRMLEFIDICGGCMRLICLGCVGKPCDPAEAKAEREEFVERLRRQGHFAPPKGQVGWRCW